MAVLIASGEYQATLHQSGSSGIPRHRDALPDGGRKHGRRRLSCMVLCSSGTSAEEGGSSPLGDSEEAYNGSVAIWPPRRMLGPQSDRAHHFQNQSPQSSHLPPPSGGVPPLGAHVGLPAARRSLGGSEASFTESDTWSLRSERQDSCCI